MVGAPVSQLHAADRYGPCLRGIKSQSSSTATCSRVLTTIWRAGISAQCGARWITESALHGIAHDGGASAQVFLYPASLDWRALSKQIGLEGESQVYVIRNAPPDFDWEAVGAQTGSDRGPNHFITDSNPGHGRFVSHLS